MLRCDEVAGRASALVDGELGWLETMRLRMHLAMCSGCRAFTEQIGITRDLTQAALEGESGDDADEARISAILSRLPADR